jgi:hypothetical protein
MPFSKRRRKSQYAAACATAALLASSANSARAVDAGLPSGAVVAFTPQTVCESLPGGWKEYTPAAGRVVVGAAPGLPASSPPAASGADFWTRGVTLKPENLPRTPVTGGGQVVVTTPEAPVHTTSAAGKEFFSGDKPDFWMFGYRPGAKSAPSSQALPVGYGSPGAVGRERPDAVPVAPPYIALRYCVKN